VGKRRSPAFDTTDHRKKAITARTDAEDRGKERKKSWVLYLPIKGTKGKKKGEITFRASKKKKCAAKLIDEKGEGVPSRVIPKDRKGKSIHRDEKKPNIPTKREGACWTKPMRGKRRGN